MIATLDNGCNGRHHARGVVEYLRVVESQHHEAQAGQPRVPSKIGLSTLRLGVVRVAVTLDQQAVADEQVCTFSVPEGQRRLGYRRYPCLMEQNAKHALGARLRTPIDKRKGPPGCRCRLFREQRAVATPEAAALHRRVEYGNRERQRGACCDPEEGGVERSDPEPGLDTARNPVDTHAATSNRRSASDDIVRDLDLKMPACAWRNPQPVVSERRDSRNAAADAGGICDVGIELREPVDTPTKAHKFRSSRSTLEGSGLSLGARNVARAGDTTEAGKSFTDARHPARMRRRGRVLRRARYGGGRRDPPRRWGGLSAPATSEQMSLHPGARSRLAAVSCRRAEALTIDRSRATLRAKPRPGGQM